jgi:hypothetical protein
MGDPVAASSEHQYPHHRELPEVISVVPSGARGPLPDRVEAPRRRLHLLRRGPSPRLVLTCSPAVMKDLEVSVSVTYLPLLTPLSHPLEW